MKKKYIKRILYLDKIAPFIDKPIIKVLVGQRRIGKSYMLLQLMDEIRDENAHIIYLDKELDVYSSITNDKELHDFVLSQLNPEKKNYLFIDEIQEIESFERCLRSLLNEERCDIYCTGSNANLLSGELATLLSGRCMEFRIHSLSYTEFLKFNQIDNSDENLMQYLTLGGMPFLHNFELQQQPSFEYLRNVYSTILLKDVVARENIRNVAFLENLVTYLVDNTGNLFSALNISKYLKSQNIKMPTQTVLNYLHALTNAFFVYRTPRIDVNGLKIFEIGEKYYFEDLGLRNAIRVFNPKSDINKLMENAVFMHLMRNGYDVFVGNNEGKEIDFVAIRNNERIYIQVAYMLYDQRTIDREFGNLMEIENHYPKYVVTMDTLPMSASYQGIQQVHLRTFLSNDTI
ncbi:MAG: ATP-binding protein [Proteiniphilum sp.]|jgi:predicted AAA+ superfamily ATPase